MDDPEAGLADALRWIAEELDCADPHYEAALADEDWEREAERHREMLTVLSLDSRSRAGPLSGCDEVIHDEVGAMPKPPSNKDRFIRGRQSALELQVAASGRESPRRSDES